MKNTLTIIIGEHCHIVKTASIKVGDSYIQDPTDGLWNCETKEEGKWATKQKLAKVIATFDNIIFEDNI